MDNLTKEDIEFLKELGKEMREQDNDFQASPRFWSIMDYKCISVGSSVDYEKKVIYSDGELISIEEAKDLIIEYDFEDELNEFLEKYDENYIWFDEEFLEIYQNRVDEYSNWVYLKEESYIAPNTMFLTKQEAKHHLKVNGYHYSEKAHTYAMTAWRAPKVKKLYEVLEKL